MGGITVEVDIPLPFGYVCIPSGWQLAWFLLFWNDIAFFIQPIFHFVTIYVALKMGLENPLSCLFFASTLLSRLHTFPNF